MFFDEGSNVCIIDTNNEKLRLLEEKISSKEKNYYKKLRRF